jgi:hypothetical protein
MTLVGETDFQLLELNLANNTWMYRADKRLKSSEVDGMRYPE